MRYNIWARSLMKGERGYDVDYFFFIKKLQKYCTTNFMCKIA